MEQYFFYQRPTSFVLFFVIFDVSMLSLFQTGTRNIKSSLFETARRESGTVQEHESHACRPPVYAL